MRTHTQNTKHEDGSNYDARTKVPTTTKTTNDGGGRPKFRRRHCKGRTYKGRRATNPGQSKSVSWVSLVAGQLENAMGEVLCVQTETMNDALEE